MPIQKTASDIMTTEVVITTTSATVAEAKHTLTRNRISGMPVLSAGKVVGIVSQADLLTAAADVKVESVMTRKVISVEPNAPVGQIAKILDDGDINRVPVMGAVGNLLGIVSRADIVAAVGAEWYWRDRS